MNVKIDTKEKFIVITPIATHLTAIMTEELTNTMLAYLQKDIPHLILNMSLVSIVDEKSCEMIANIQQEFYENNCSFIICELQKAVEEIFDGLALLELLNVTPTESEAWDIIQMEEIERELLGDED
ncbi:MAG: STAS domain-containing protein [Ferruginibacter sp.]|nr:STAS domain-containing protein [Ferruginibacter sp.]